MSEDNNTVKISTLIDNDNYIKYNSENIKIDGNNVNLNYSDKSLIVDQDEKIQIEGFYDSDGTTKIAFKEDHTLTLNTNLEIKKDCSLEIDKAKLVIKKDSIINGTLKCVTLQV